MAGFVEFPKTPVHPASGGFRADCPVRGQIFAGLVPPTYACKLLCLEIAPTWLATLHMHLCCCVLSTQLSKLCVSFFPAQPNNFASSSKGQQNRQGDTHPFPIRFSTVTQPSCPVCICLFFSVSYTDAHLLSDGSDTLFGSKYILNFDFRKEHFILPCMFVRGRVWGHYLGNVRSITVQEKKNNIWLTTHDWSCLLFVPQS